LLKYKQKGRLKNIQEIFLNIEFRIQQPNKDDEYINIHVLFSNDPVVVGKIHGTLSRLKLITTSVDETSLYCNDSGLGKVGYANALVEMSELLNVLQDDYIEPVRCS